MFANKNEEYDNGTLIDLIDVLLLICFVSKMSCPTPTKFVQNFRYIKTALFL